MRSFIKASFISALLLSGVGSTSVLGYSYYTHYSNAYCQVTLTLPTKQIPVGGTLSYSVTASGYNPGPSGGGPSLTIPVDVLVDDQYRTTLNAPWYPYGVTPVESSIASLTPGPHAVTLQHVNAFEYKSDTVFLYSQYVDPTWGSSYWNYYYNVYHYWTAPCSDTETVNVFVDALFPNSGPHGGGNSLTITSSIIGTVTNVLVGGAAAAITGSGEGWVTVTVPALRPAGTKAIIFQTSDQGDITLASAYTVNPAGVIGADQQAALAAGYSHSLGLKSYGSIVAWGRSSEGQTIVRAPNTNFVAVAAGYLHSLALKADGSIVAEGLNSHGQTVIPTPNADFVTIAGGGYHSLGLKSGGNIVSWGDNGRGQAAVPSPNTNFISVAAGYYHSLGLKLDGSMVAWGTNDFGQTVIPTPNTDFVAVAAGYYHSLGLKSDGSIVAWGDNASGRTNVPSPNTDFVAVAGGAYHSLGLKSDGSIVAWGDNANGQTNVPPPNTDFVAVAAGGTHSLGLKSDGRIVAWGNNGNGQTNAPSPNTDFGLPSGVQPKAGAGQGGYEVVISGKHLGNGTDITNVTLCGVAAAIVSQSSTQVVVTAAAGTPGTGDVAVYSTSYGVTTKTFGFTYQKTEQTITFPTIGDKVTTDTVGLSATASSGLPVSFSVASGPAVINSGTNLTFIGTGTVSIVASQSGDTLWNAATDVTNTFNVIIGSPVIGISGNLSFGNVTTGTTATATLTITNSGNATLTVTDIIYPDGFSGAWSGTVAAGCSHTVTVTFAPATVSSYSGTATVNSDATSGTSTISVSGTGIVAVVYEKAITGFQLTTANSGTLVNSPAWVAGKYGNAISLSDNKYVEVPAPAPDIFNMTGDLTIVLWVKPSTVTCSGLDPAYALVSKRSGNNPTPYELYIGNGGSLLFHYWGTDIQWPVFQATGTITSGAWQHIAVTRSLSGANATVTFYINGVEAGRSTSATGLAQGSSNPVWLGKDGYHTYYTNEGCYSGLMDEVQMFNRALTAQEVSQIVANIGTPIMNRVGNWTFDEGGGTAAFDTVADGYINESAKTVTGLVPAGTAVNALIPRITTSPQTTVAPLSGVAQNFASPIIYTVTAEDLSTQSYTVTVAVPSGLSDADGNGLPDVWELQYFNRIGINPNALCANGVNTVLEAYIAGLHPNEPQSRFTISNFRSLSEGKAFDWNTVSGRLYSVYWTTNLLNSFQPLETNIPWTRNSFTNAPTVPQGFYKIKVDLAD